LQRAAPAVCGIPGRGPDPVPLIPRLPPPPEKRRLLIKRIEIAHANTVRRYLTPA